MLDERAHAFTQALLARGALKETDARELYRHIHKRSDGARLERIAAPLRLPLLRALLDERAGRRRRL